MIPLSLLSLLLAPAALAIPSRRDGGFQGACNVSQSVFSIPEGLDAISNPPVLTAVGVGVQNYTCNATGSFQSSGALALLLDISCLAGQNEFNNIPADALGFWNLASTSNPFDGILQQTMQAQFNLNATGQHYFQNISGNLAPVFDFRSIGPFAGNSNAFVVAQKDKSIPSPDNPSNDVAWLELTATSGEFANIIYRINTAGGQPPGSCNPGDTGTFKYAARYVFI